MTEERILSLDISTKTGWALLISTPEEAILEQFGQIPKIPEPDLPYPTSYVDWAYLCFKEIVELVDRTQPDILVIEETSKGSKNNYSQKILEFIHFLVAKFIKDTGIKCAYIMVGTWRSETGCSMTKEESKKNKKVREYKKQNKTSIAYDENGKRVGIINKKHVNIRRANEIFGKYLPRELKKKDEDLADSLLLGFCYHLRRVKRL